MTEAKKYGYGSTIGFGNNAHVNPSTNIVSPANAQGFHIYGALSRKKRKTVMGKRFEKLFAHIHSLKANENSFDRRN